MCNAITSYHITTNIITAINIAQIFMNDNLNINEVGNIYSICILNAFNKNCKSSNYNIHPFNK